MARHKSAQKAARQAIKRQKRNHALSSRCHTLIKKLETTIGSGKKEAAQLTTLFNQVQSSLMKAISKGVFKPKTAQRKISRLGKAIHKAGASA